jgi:hypothetical protein
MKISNEWPGRLQPALRLVLALVCLVVAGTGRSGGQERSRLYTEPDATSPGGMQGTIVNPVDPILQILAIPPDAPENVYEGKLSGNGGQFQFTGLPLRKYDLVVIYEDAVYEGTQLHRGESTLTDEDLVKIDAIIQKAEPYFKTKVIHRVEGMTGQGNLSRCFCTFYREEGAKVRRTFKLVLLKDVGPGWQIVRTRDLYPMWTNLDLADPPHHYNESLAGVRVADSVKDLGEIDLRD